MELVDRVKYIMKLNQLSASQFADEIGVQRSSVSHVLTGRNKPSLEFIQKVINRYPKVDAGWLINGTTNVVPKEERVSVKQEHNEIKTNTIEAEKPINKLDLGVDEIKPIASNRQINRILVFYTDHTFEEFNPLKSTSK